ncbi:MAG: N-acetylmuramoyl-L-alanine amidase [Chloroflexi bacterium]|nr:N-acetylmuramoyl-L-alanine amidase [Chloroflexota bacterium]
MANWRALRLSRRMFLTLLGAAGLALPGSRPPLEAASPVRTTRWETVPGPDATESPVFVAPHPFNAVGVLWQGALDSLQVRVRQGERWSAWWPVALHPAAGRRPAGPWRSSTLLAFAPAGALQYRLTRPGVTVVRCELIDTTSGPQLQAVTVPRAVVVSRAQWGCDERLRFKDGEEVWPVEYAPVEKVVVHHTATANEEADPAATVRSIYVYHATIIDNGGWGDIGYNLLVDWRGTVYEGRYGGPGAVGAHASGYNTGSCGVAFLGTFTSTYIPAAAEAGCASVIAASFGYLDPFGSSFFADKTLPNICGHRDCLPTQCPGDFGYRQLNNLRDAVARQRGTPRPQAQLTAVRFFSEAAAQDCVRFEVEVWNNSAQPLETQGPDPGYAYDETQTSASIGHPGQFNRWRIGIDFLDNTTGRRYPFRWGLGGTLAPGERRLISGQIELTTPKRSLWWAGLIQEGVAFRVDMFGVSRPLLTTPSRLFLPLVARNASEPDASTPLRAR